MRKRFLKELLERLQSTIHAKVFRLATLAPGRGCAAACTAGFCGDIVVVARLFAWLAEFRDSCGVSDGFLSSHALSVCSLNAVAVENYPHQKTSPAHAPGSNS
jgi:hypothetical protein